MGGIQRENSTLKYICISVNFVFLKKRLLFNVSVFFVVGNCQYGKQEKEAHIVGVSVLEILSCFHVHRTWF